MSGRIAEGFVAERGREKGFPRMTDIARQLIKQQGWPLTEAKSVALLRTLNMTGVLLPPMSTNPRTVKNIDEILGLVLDTSLAEIQTEIKARTMDGLTDVDPVPTPPPAPTPVRAPLPKPPQPLTQKPPVVNPPRSCEHGTPGCPDRGDKHACREASPVVEAPRVIEALPVVMPPSEVPVPSPVKPPRLFGLTAQKTPWAAFGTARDGTDGPGYIRVTAISDGSVVLTPPELRDMLAAIEAAVSVGLDERMYQFNSSAALGAMTPVTP